MAESKKVKELREKLEQQVHPNVDALVQAIAERHTVLNLGQSWPDPTFARLLSECTSDEEYRAVKSEFKSWLKDAKKEAAAIVKAGLPLTLANADDVFYKRGPFAK